ncbi:hypothetical protein [Litorivivens sp.]|uniref:hypothetical protein n=1 Tax=Litorivivens sp. TaxID=2020868 RepID=UPI00356A70CD
MTKVYGGNNNNASSNAQMPEPPPPSPPPAPQQQDFTVLVLELFAATTDKSEPLQINDLNLVFADQDNPAAFDGLLQ